MSRLWLLFQKSDETRISQGIDAYADHAGKVYAYDSLVPNHKQLSADDRIVLRVEDAIVGVGIIAKIETSNSVKIHRRCSACGTTDIRRRASRNPPWKCGRCRAEFDIPSSTETRVVAYHAHFSRFSQIKNPPSAKVLKACAVKGDGLVSQLSMLELDRKQIVPLLRDEVPNWFFDDDKPRQIYPETRIVKARALRVAKDLYERDAWVIRDSPVPPPYDFCAERAAHHHYVRVMYGVRSCHEALLTSEEVARVRSDIGRAALVVVEGVQTITERRGVLASDGYVSRHVAPWCIADDSLEAIQFIYSLPPE